MLFTNILGHLRVHVGEEVSQTRATSRCLLHSRSLNALIHNPVVAAQLTDCLPLTGLSFRLGRHRWHCVYLLLDDFDRRWSLLLLLILLCQLSLQVADLVLKLCDNRPILLEHLLIAQRLLLMHLSLLLYQHLSFFALLSIKGALLVDQILRDLILDLTGSLSVLERIHSLLVTGEELGDARQHYCLGVATERVFKEACQL